jgi:hypothetical protein
MQVHFETFLERLKPHVNYCEVLNMLFPKSTNNYFIKLCYKKHSLSEKTVFLVVPDLINCFGSILNLMQSSLGRPNCNIRIVLISEHFNERRIEDNTKINTHGAKKQSNSSTSEERLPVENKYIH